MLSQLLTDLSGSRVSALQKAQYLRFLYQFSFSSPIWENVLQFFKANQ